MINKLFIVISPHKMRGCHDDRIGEIHAMHSFEELKEGGEFEASTTGNREHDFCLCQKGIQDDVFRLKYRIERVH